MSKDFPYRLYLVVGEKDCHHHPIEYVVEEAIKGGVDMVQLREKDKNFKDFVKTAQKIKKITDQYKIPFIINDHVKVTIEVEVDGIHVGQNDVEPSVLKNILKKKQWIGYSIEDLSELNSSEIKYVHYIAASPIFDTPTKTDTNAAWGIDELKLLREKTSLPIVAIGGMNADNAKEIIEAGADCIAVVSAISHAKDPQQAAKTLKNIIEVSCKK